MWDHTGRRYLDFSSQRVTLNIGHQHPSIVQASIEQVGSLATVAPSTVNLARSEAKKRIVDRAPAQVNEVFFTNGGAIEDAMRMARMHTGRDKVPSAYLSHHFNTGAAVVATGAAYRTNLHLPTCTSLAPSSTAASSGRPHPNRTARVRFATSSA